MRLIGYIRVSRVGGRQGETFISPAQQRDRIAAHAVANNHTIVGWQEDLDQSGGRMDRPALERAIAAIETGEADGVAVAKLDRFARSVPGAAKGLQRIEDAGGVLVAIDLGMDTSTPAGKLMRNVLMALAEFELDRIRESWDDAKTRAVGRGVHISPKIPFGYQRDRDGRLTVDQATGPLVARVFEMRAAGVSWRQIALWLDQHTDREGLWPVTTLANIVKSRTYLGEASSGEHLNVDGHPALVSRDLWERAQVESPKPLVFRGGSLLSGLLRCAGCGYTMSRTTGGRRGRDFYRCRGRHAAGECPEIARVIEEEADRWVTDRYLAFVSDITVSDSALTVDVERAASRLEQAEAELVAYRDANLITVLGPQVYRDGLESRARTVEDARQTLGDTQRVVGMVGQTNIAERWPDLTVFERRELLTASIDCVFIRRQHSAGEPLDKRMRLLFAGTGPSDLPGRRVSGIRPFLIPDD